MLKMRRRRRQCIRLCARCSVVNAAEHDRQCREFAEFPCVFVVALGRTGSTHLLRLLNSISGYRLSGETDNAWIYMGWFARARLAKLQQGELGGEDSSQKLVRRRPNVATLDLNSSDVLCDMRQMMLLLHNPSPRARHSHWLPCACCALSRFMHGFLAAECLALRRSTPLLFGKLS